MSTYETMSISGDPALVLLVPGSSCREHRQPHTAWHWGEASHRLALEGGLAPPGIEGSWHWRAAAGENNASPVLVAECVMGMTAARLDCMS